MEYNVTCPDKRITEFDWHQSALFADYFANDVVSYPLVCQCVRMAIVLFMDLVLALVSKVVGDDVAYSIKRELLVFQSPLKHFALRVESIVPENDVKFAPGPPAFYDAA